MDTDMEDVGRVPEPARLSPATEPASIPTLDGWIENLMTCKQLAESDVQRLCEKVCTHCDTVDERETMERGGLLLMGD
jgi:serine/threonine-protein phosphatase 2A catalytic subunit